MKYHILHDFRTSTSFDFDVNLNSFLGIVIHHVLNVLIQNSPW